VLATTSVARASAVGLERLEVLEELEPLEKREKRVHKKTIFILTPKYKMQNNNQEAYVHLSADKKTLTFYYDALRAERDGTTWGIEDKKEYLNDLIPAWVGNSKSPNTSILTAVFDASFRDFRPTTTAGWFQYLEQLKTINGWQYLNTSQVTDMR